MYTPGKARAEAGILVVRLGSMGDVIHALPAVATLKHSFPGSHLSWAIEPKWACLVEGNPFVDRVVLFERRTLAGIRKAWRELRAKRYAFAVDFQGLIKSALVASAARPDRIYGFHQSQAREPLASLCYSKRVYTRAAHIVERNLELAAAAGATSMLSAFPLPEGSPEGDLPSEFVLASPLAGWPAKQWPPEYYAALAERVRRELRLPLVLNGPPGAAGCSHISGIPGLIHATRRALAVVGIDSGPMHLAAALGKPGVALFGPTDPARNGPYGNSFAVLRAPGALTSYKRKREPDAGMRAITPDTVFAALKERLASRTHSADSFA